MSDEQSPERLPPRITDLLRAWSGGDPRALAELIPLVNDDLRRLARTKFRGEKPGQLLQPTALVNEFFLHLSTRRKVSWENRKQFFKYASRMMHRTLVNYARDQKRLKRGGESAKVSLGPEHEQVFFENPNHEVVLAIGEALSELEKVDEDAAEVVRLRFFIGMTVEETAEALERARATVNRDWKFAKLWLFQKLKGNSEFSKHDEES